MERIGRVLGKNRGRNQKSFPLFLSIKQLGLAIVFALFLLGCGNNGKTNNDVTDNTLNKKPVIRAEEAFETTRTNIRGEVRPQWKKSDSLFAHASTRELIQIASKHTDIIERLVAFRALLMKNPHEAVNVAIAEIEDTTIVHLSDGFCGEEDVMSNVRISMLQYEKGKYNVSLTDSMRIDSAVLFSANSSKFYYSNDLYHRLPAKPEYESRLRLLYKHDHHALIALARYHREKDKQEIIRQLSQIENKDLFSYRDTIRAIMDVVAAWPSATYKQKVRQVCQTILDKKDADSYATSAFGALMAYNDRWSYNLIDKTLSNAKQRDEYYFDFRWSLHEAYENNPLPLFKPLLRKYPLKSGE
jgi:hypothetical protein